MDADSCAFACITLRLGLVEDVRANPGRENGRGGLELLTLTVEQGDHAIRPTFQASQNQTPGPE